MSINHLKNFIGENLHIGCVELVSESPILLDDKALISVKQNITEETEAPRIVWGEVVDYDAGDSGTISGTNLSYNWDASVAGRCFVTVPSSVNLNRGGNPIIMVNTRNVVGVIQNPNLGGFCFCAKLLNSYTIELDFYSFISIGNRPFCIAVIY